MPTSFLRLHVHILAGGHEEMDEHVLGVAVGLRAVEAGKAFEILPQVLWSSKDQEGLVLHDRSAADREFQQSSPGRLLPPQRIRRIEEDEIEVFRESPEEFKQK